MTGPKIKVSADVSSVNSSMGQTSAGMRKATADAKALEDQLKRVARAQAALAKEGIKISRDQAEAAKKAFDAWKSSGARGTSKIRNSEFDDWAGGGWRNYSMNSGESVRHRNSVLNSIGVNGPGTRQSFMQFIANATSTAGRGIARSILPMGGVGGGIASGGVEAASGTSGGMFSGGGLARILGGAGIGALALGAFKMIQGVHAGMGRAEGEAGDYSDLRRSIGVTTTDFDDLRTSVRHFSEGLGLAYNETAKLASEYARSAALRSANGLGQEVGSAAGFGRSYGLNPQATVQFMASMRHMGVTGGDGDNRKLALMIAESVERGGTTSKMSEVLSSIQSFTSMATRASLTTANASGYASFLSSMTGSSLYGLKGDPENAAATMGAADSAMRRGGAFGQASRSFSLGMYQRRLRGFNALDMDYMDEQGAFGTINGAFGRNSAAYSFAKSRGDRGLMSKYDMWSSKGGDQTVLAMQMQALEKEFGGNTDGFRKSIMSHFGVGSGQAGALFSAYKSDRGLGGLQAMLKGAGVDTNGMNTQTISSLAALAGGDGVSLQRQASRLQGLKGSSALTKDESNLLAGAGTEEELRKVVLRLTSIHDTSKDEGTKLREQQADMANAMQELATKLIPLTIAIKDGIVEVVRWVSKVFGGSDWVDKMDMASRDESARKSYAGRSGGERARSLNDVLLAPKGTYSDEYLDEVKRDLAQSMSTPSTLTNSNASKGKGPLNLRNNNPGNIRAGRWASKHGAIGENGGFAVFPDAATGSAAMDSLLQSYASKDGLNTVSGIVNKWAPPQDNNDVSAYVKDVTGKMGVSAHDKLNMKDPSVRAALGKAMAGHEGSSAAYVAGGELTITDNRNLTGHKVPLILNKRIASPMPAGMGGVSG